MSIEHKLENFLIPLEEIKSGTDNFSEANCIGGGGFGRVYKGKLAAFRTSNIVAIKRLDPNSGQGKIEFEKEVDVLYLYKHKNIVTFIGYCNEGGEMIIVYEYATNGSLDKHLCDPNKIRCVTWLQRLKICVGAARGLNYLHCGLGAHHRIIHRDVKSSNILLDNNWEAKVSDFGLSKFGPKDQPYTMLDTRVAGTDGYCDPYYRGTDILTKESDVYSLGVVLFEMLCGRLVFPKNRSYTSDDNSRSLVQLVWRYKDSLDKIIDPYIRDQIDPKSLCTFKELAMQCLIYDYSERPTMTMVLEKLEEAFDSQEKHELKRQVEVEYKEIIQMSDLPLVYDTKEELLSLLSNGMFIDSGKKWFSLSSLNGKNSLKLSSKDLFDENDGYICGWSSIHKSRFSEVAKLEGDLIYKRVHITTNMLSLETTYAVFIICTPELVSGRATCNKQEMRPAECGDNEWVEVELFHFTNRVKVAIFDFEIHFKRSVERGFWDKLVRGGARRGSNDTYVEGIEFRPIDVDVEEESEFPEIDFDMEWEQKLPSNYEEILKRTSNIVVLYTTRKQAYSLMTAGIFLDNYSMWFRLDKSTEKICAMLSPKMLIVTHDGEPKRCNDNDSWFSYSGGIKSIKDENSRFSLVLEFNRVHSFNIQGTIKAQMLSSKTHYAAWLVFKIFFYGDNLVSVASLTLGKQKQQGRHVYLVPSSQMIQPLNDLESLHQVNKRRLDRRAWERNDGWMEVELFPFFNDIEDDTQIEIGLHTSCTKAYLSLDLMVQGIEFRPKNIKS